MTPNHVVRASSASPFHRLRTATKNTLSLACAVPAFDLRAFLDAAGAGTIARHLRGAVVFSQGDSAGDVFYLQHGSVKLSVLSRTGREAVVATLRPGEFFGEGCLAGQPGRPVQSGTAPAQARGLQWSSCNVIT